MDSSDTSIHSRVGCGCLWSISMDAMKTPKPNWTLTNMPPPQVFTGHPDKTGGGPVSSVQTSPGGVKPENNFSQLLFTFLAGTTAHGLPRVVTSGSWFRRILWLVIFLTALGYFCYQATELFTNYYEYPVGVRIDITSKMTTDFPAITVCNMNMMKKSSIQSDVRYKDLVHIDQYTEWEMRKKVHQAMLNTTAAEEAADQAAAEDEEAPKRRRKRGTKTRPSTKREFSNAHDKLMYDQSQRERVFLINSALKNLPKDVSDVLKRKLFRKHGIGKLKQKVDQVDGTTGQSDQGTPAAESSTKLRALPQRMRTAPGDEQNSRPKLRTGESLEKSLLPDEKFIRKKRNTANETPLRVKRNADPASYPDEYYEDDPAYADDYVGVDDVEDYPEDDMSDPDPITGDRDYVDAEDNMDPDMEDQFWDDWYADEPALGEEEDYHYDEEEYSENADATSDFEDVMDDIDPDILQEMMESEDVDMETMQQEFEFEDYGFMGRVSDDFAFKQFMKASQTADYSDLVDVLKPSQEDLDSYGHQAADFIKQCSFDKKNCTYRDFRKVYNPYFGLCYVFNHGKDNTSVAQSSKFGSRYGLRLTLDIEYGEYLGLFSHKAGARLAVHPHDITAFPQDFGISAAPGMETEIGVSSEIVTREPSPYPSNCTDGSSHSLSYEGNYTITACSMTCLQEKLKEMCGCVDKLVTNGQEDRCSLINATQEKCRQVVYYLYDTSSLGCDCPASCQDHVYKVYSSTSQWPSDPYSYLLAASLVDKDATYLHGHLLDAIKTTMVRVHVYLDDPTMVSIKEYPSYPWDRLLADIGGLLGLFIGVSMCTGLELLELLVDVTIVGIKGCTRTPVKTAPHPPKLSLDHTQHGQAWPDQTVPVDT